MDWSPLWTSSLDWVVLHPIAAYLSIFLIFLSESMALIGLLVPGTVMMVGIGALAGSGVLSLQMTLLAAIIGAIVGDGVSYWLGRHYHQELKRFWPFSRFTVLMTRGETFFQSHGGKSVFLGRFVGPVRPIIPVVAGMLDMPAWRFLLVNILSAIGWAFTYLIPGVVLGTFLTLVGAVSTRLALLLLCFAGLIWFAYLLARQGSRLFVRLEARSEHRLLLLLGLASWIFLGVVEDLLTQDPLVKADQAVYHFLQALRSPWGDTLLVGVTELGDATTNTAVVVVILMVLILNKQLRSAGYWLLAVGGGVGLVQLFKWSLHRPRPIAIYQGVSSWGFPSGHTTMSVVVYGFLAVLLVRGLASRWRWIPFVLAFAISLLVAFSRIYLGAHWLSDILGGLALGWAWVTLLSLFYLKNPTDKPLGRKLLPMSLLALLVVGSWHIGSHHSADLIRYRNQEPLKVFTETAWQDQEFRQLAAWRYTLLGDQEQPLTLQMADILSARERAPLVGGDG